MGKLFRLTEKLVNTPHLMTQSTLDNSMQYLTMRNESQVQVELAVDGGSKKNVKQLSYNPDTGIGLLSVDGPLTYIEYEGLCGEHPTSYQRLQSEFEAMADAGAKTIILDIDSPGGEAYGCFETANALRSRADAEGIHLIAYVDGLAASAAYGLAVAAHEIIANPFAEVGSIGVVVQLANKNAAERKIGIERSYVYAGESKIPFDSDGKFTEGFLADIQEKVDSLYLSFISHVAEMRNLSQESVKDTKAKVFLAPKAVELGLVDQTMTREEFFTYLSEVVESGDNMSLKAKLFKSNTTMESTEDMAKLEEIQATLEAAIAEKDGVSAQLAALQTEFATAQTALTAALAELSEFKAKAEAAELAAKEAATAARKQMLVKAAGAEKAESLFAKLEALDDEAFAEVVETIAQANRTVDDSALFQSMGVDGDGRVEDQEKAGLALVGQLIAKTKSN